MCQIKWENGQQYYKCHSLFHNRPGAKEITVEGLAQIQIKCLNSQNLRSNYLLTLLEPLLLALLLTQHKITQNGST